MSRVAPSGMRARITGALSMRKAARGEGTIGYRTPSSYEMPRFAVTFWPLRKSSRCPHRSRSQTRATGHPGCSCKKIEGNETSVRTAQHTHTHTRLFLWTLHVLLSRYNYIEPSISFSKTDHKCRLRSYYYTFLAILFDITLSVG